jgi:TonB family protein
MLAKYLSVLLLLFSLAARGQEVRYVKGGYDRIADNVGGPREFRRVFEQEVIYPEKALKEGEGGKVELRFLIMADGSTSDLKVWKSAGPELDAEAIRIFKKLQWKPTIFEGKAVNSYYLLKFSFDPGKYKRICKRRGYEQPVYSKQPVDTSFTIHAQPDTMPVYPQGPYALAEFIAKNLQYPKAAALQNLQGTVQLSFVVEPTGLMTNIGIVKGVGGGCNEEAVRVLEMIKWVPGVKDGKAVRVSMTIPVNFVLNNQFKDNSTSEQGW